MTDPSKKDVDIISKLRQLIRDELRGIYTTSMCIVEDVEVDRQRVEVSLKTDLEVFVGNVPILTPFATDDAGMIVPVESGDEGLLVHIRHPVAEQLQERGHQEVNTDRRFQLESAVFLPGVWLEADDIPDHEDGDLVIQHQSGTRIEMAEDGSVTIEAEEVYLGQPDSTAKVLTEDAEIQYDGGGDNSGTLTADITDPGSEHTEAS